jgi:2-methylcitrate dehydratase PrpD
MSTKFDPEVITAGLGERFELLSNMYKPYACGLVVHAAIDGCIDIVREHRLAPEAIEAVELTVSPLVLELTGNTTPQTGLEGKFSVYHAVSAAIIHGAAGEAQFTEACVRDPRVVAVRNRVSAKVDAAIGRTEARVTIRTRDGRAFNRHVEHALGTLARPMSDADLEAKFRGLAGEVLPAAQVEEIIKLCWQLPALRDAGTLARAAVPR